MFYCTSFPQIIFLLYSNNHIGPSEWKIISFLFSFRLCKEAHSVVLCSHFLGRGCEPHNSQTEDLCKLKAFRELNPLFTPGRYFCLHTADVEA